MVMNVHSVYLPFRVQHGHADPDAPIKAGIDTQKKADPHDEGKLPDGNDTGVDNESWFQHEWDMLEAKWKNSSGPIDFIGVTGLEVLGLAAVAGAAYLYIRQY